jgi:hypothetical protein
LGGRLLLEGGLTVEQVEGSKLNANLSDSGGGHDDSLRLGAVARSLGESRGTSTQELVLRDLLDDSRRRLEGLLDDGGRDDDGTSGVNVVGGEVSLDGLGDLAVGRVRRLWLVGSYDGVGPAFTDTEGSGCATDLRGTPGAEGGDGGGSGSLVPVGGLSGGLLRGGERHDGGGDLLHGGGYDGGRCGDDNGCGRGGDGDGDGCWCRRGRSWLGRRNRSASTNRGQTQSTSTQYHPDELTESLEPRTSWYQVQSSCSPPSPWEQQAFLACRSPQ